MSNETTAPEESPFDPIEPDEQMHIDPVERNWMFVAGGVTLIFFVAVTIAGFALGIQVPTDEGRVDPNTLDSTSPWDEPGLREVVPGEEYDLVIVARRFFFEPNDVVIPKGATVNFIATAADVQHGIKLGDTNVNMMLIPGQENVVDFPCDREQQQQQQQQPRPAGICALLQPGETLDPKSIDFSSLTLEKPGGKGGGGSKKGSKKKQQQQRMLLV